jgi:hypothetical protein
MADQKPGGGQFGELPSFDNKKVYLVKGDSLNRIIALAKSNQVRVATGSGLAILAQNEQGKYLGTSGGTIDLQVCINGVAVTKTFLLA